MKNETEKTPLSTAVSAPEIVIDYGPCGYCPMQAEGYIDGYPFYFRSRYEHMSLRVASTKDGDAVRNAGWLYREYYGVGAGVVNVDECKAFIKKAAAMWREAKGAAK